MIYVEIVAAIPHLSHEERLALMQILMRSFIESDDSAATAPSNTVLELCGVLKDVAEMPTDEAVHQAYKDYLEAKYR